MFKNDIFFLGDRRMRMLHHAARDGVAWCIALDQPRAWPEQLRWADVAHLESLAPGEQDQDVGQSHSPAANRKCQEAWERLSPLLTSCGEKLLQPSYRNQAVLEHADRIGCSPRTLQKDLQRYWQRGQTMHALMPAYGNCGVAQERSERGQERVPQPGRGRRPRDGSSTFTIKLEDVRAIRAAVERFYLSNPVATLTSTYKELLRLHYRYEDGNGTKCLNPAGERPSMRQFTSLVYKLYDFEHRVRSREGDSDYERKYRSVLGSVLADCLGVGHQYEIDASIADAFLVAMMNVNKIIGKPTLYLIVDRHSRLIVGFYFGLESPSWVGAMQAMLSISEDKAALCERYGVKYDPDDWPAHGVFPSEFFCDRGEMLSKNSSSIATCLHSTVVNLPAKRPDWKPLVECGFKLIQRDLSADTPGYEPPENVTKRQGKRYDKDACLTLRDFGHILINAIIARNRKVMRDYPLTPQELAEGVTPSPIELWNHGICERSGQLTHYSERAVRLALLPKAVATVTQHGIEFKGCTYSCPEAIESKWFEKARQRRFNVQVSYDPRLVDQIQVHPLNLKGAPYIATLTARGEHYRGRSFAEVSYFEHLRAAVAREADLSNLQAAIDLTDRNEPRIQAAKKRLQDERSGTTRHHRRKDTKAARQEERALERQETGRMVPPAKPNYEAAASSGTASSSAAATSPKDLMAEKLKAARQKLLNGESANA